MGFGSALIGALRVSLSLDTAAFEKGANIAQKRAAAMGKNMESVGKRVSAIGRTVSIGLSLPFTALMTQAIPAALEAREAIGQVNAALQSMGPVAGFTAEQLQQMAGQLQHISKFDDDEILKKVTANMLTFGNVSGQIFERAQVAVVNLASRLDEDLQSAAIQVGKALNDPIKGVTALRRVGVQLTQQQQDQVKAMVAVGDVAGAQKIILGELEREFGGAAKAMRDASPAADLQEKWRTFQEVIGEVALKVLPPLTAFLTKLLALFNQMSPTTQAVVVGVVALGAAFGPLLLAIGSLIQIIGVLTPAVIGLDAALSPILGPLALVAAAVIAVYLAWRNWDKITAIVASLYKGVKTWIVDKLSGVFNWLKGKLQQVGDWFFKLYDRVVGHSYVPDMIDKIGENFDRLQEEMVAPAMEAVDQVDTAFQRLAQNTQFALSVPQVQTSPLKDWANDAADISDELSNLEVGGIQAFADSLSKITDGWKAMRDSAIQAIHQIIQELIRLAIMKAIAGLFGGGGFDAGGFAGVESGNAVALGLPNNFFRASGGPVMSGKPYIVGERGPELFVPKGSGDIVPNHKLGMSSGPVINFNISGNPTRETVNQIAVRTRGAIASANRGGY